jgi:hypothetical protein
MPRKRRERLMARKKSVRPEFVFGAIFVGFIIFGLVASWWKTHSAIGWAVIVILLGAFSFALYRFPGFRQWVLLKGKSAKDKVVYEAGEPPREQIPRRLYDSIMARAGGHCENPDCKSDTRPHIHHINQNNGENDSRNLIALCPNCHRDAHHGNKFSFSQLRNFVQMSHNRSKKPERA